MDWKLFWEILGVGIALVVVQGISSWFDGYLTQTQMHSRGVTNGWAFVEHGGMWADVFVISPIVAFAVSRYQLHFFSIGGMEILAIAIALSFAMGMMYQKNGLATPEAHTHDGKTTLAGWIHGMFAVVALWVCAMFYLNMTTPPVSRGDLVVFSLILTPFFYLGVAKFSKRWAFDRFAKRQVALEMIVVWSITAIRLLM